MGSNEASRFGAIGGAVRSDAKTAAVRANGALGGRPRAAYALLETLGGGVRFTADNEEQITRWLLERKPARRVTYWLRLPSGEIRRATVFAIPPPDGVPSEHDFPGVAATLPTETQYAIEWGQE